MDFQTKLFRWPDRGNYVIIIARGQTDIGGFQQMFQKLAEIHEALVDWRVLIDLFDARFRLEPAGVDTFARDLGQPDSLRITKLHWWVRERSGSTISFAW
jgi:hypothetical protein